MKLARLRRLENFHPTPEKGISSATLVVYLRLEELLVDDNLPWILWGLGIAALLGWVLTRRDAGAPTVAQAVSGGPAAAVKGSVGSATKKSATSPSTKSAAKESAKGEPAVTVSAGGAVTAPPPSDPKVPVLPRFSSNDEDDEDAEADITRVTVAPKSEPSIPITTEAPVTEVKKPVAPSTVPIIYDEDAALDEPTGPVPRILVSAAGQSDRGKRRKLNEDSYLILPEHSLFMIADGMGGYAGGEIASKLAVDTVATAYKDKTFRGKVEEQLPRRGEELALAIKMANAAILAKAQSDKKLDGMGTTVVSARFSPNKERVYIGHVGDSRCYRLRGNEFVQITTDHTVGQLTGLTGPTAAHLVRAVGNRRSVMVDVIIAKPQPDDLYMLCSDGLSKMATDEQVRELLLGDITDLQVAVDRLIDFANEQGGKDNVTIILVQVRSGLKVPFGKGI
jgi:protein phosphatase